jgi:hypothetical protein
MVAGDAFNFLQNHAAFDVTLFSRYSIHRLILGMETRGNCYELGVQKSYD